MTYVTETYQIESRNRIGAASRTKQGQGEFQDELVEQLPDVRKYALSLTQDHSEASDLVQDCMLKALEKRQQYQKDTQMRRWLFTILRNRYLDKWRQRRRRGTHVPVDDCHQASLSHPASQEDWMELKNCQSELGKLEPNDRAILLLSVFSRLSHKEIASALEVAEGTIRSRLSRARAQLKSAT